MNSNEHLDFYNPDSIYYANSYHYIQQLEAMLRQQQAEIEALKGLIEVMRMGQPNIDYDKELLKPTFVGRELTDEEIMVLYEEYIETQYASESNVLGFARAILRKAQE